MGAISDLLESLKITPVTPKTNLCNGTQAAPVKAVTPITQITREKINVYPQNRKQAAAPPPLKTKAWVMRVCVDGQHFTAIDVTAADLSTAIDRQRSRWGNMLETIAYQGEPVYPASEGLNAAKSS